VLVFGSRDDSLALTVTVTALGCRGDGERGEETPPRETEEEQSDQIDLTSNFQALLDDGQHRLGTRARAFEDLTAGFGR
jgi:hypothetical protein